MQFDSILIYRKRFYYIFIFTCLAFVTLSYVLSKVFNNHSIAGILLLIVFGLVITGDYIFKKLFVSDIQINIEEASIFLKINTNKHIKETQISFSEIEWYSMEIINPKFYKLRFKLRSGKKLSLSFPQVSSKPTNNDSLEILEAINSKIGDFNKLNQGESIELKPTFYASSAGNVALLIFSLLSISTLILITYYSQNASFFGLLFVVLGIIQLYIRRRKNIDFYNKMYEANL